MSSWSSKLKEFVFGNTTNPQSMPNEDQITFNFEDGTSVTLDKFPINRANEVYVNQPAKIPGQYTNTVGVYVKKELSDFLAANRYVRTYPQNTWLDRLQLGVANQKLAMGIPRGAYVPLKWNAPMNRFEVFLLGITNEVLLYDSSITSPDVVEQVKKHEASLKKEAEEPAPTVDVPVGANINEDNK